MCQTNQAELKITEDYFGFGGFYRQTGADGSNSNRFLSQFGSSPSTTLNNNTINTSSSTREFDHKIIKTYS